ncbi:AAA family ATPase [Shewanella oncorhynchi]|uniref:AAA family ATPase n=1 Tax=Shewanella oncorhynchi TaxID=2726434 RepID=UPI002E7AE88D|nr:AAA family ATPase [Shewanella oncorhynchi]WVI95369.1 AAA family ATPase [Shewanella oncorhynchi]
MISKISIQNIASYKTVTILATDKKVNVVYGLNGSGKSTLSNYLYQPEAPEYHGCSVDMAKDTSLYVYNQRFIEENFYEADNLKGIFSLSKENKDIEKAINEAQAELSKQVLVEEKEQQVASDEKAELSANRSRAYDVTWKIKQEFTGGDRVLEGFLDGLKGNKETLYTHLSSLTKPAEKPNTDISKLKAGVEALKGDAAQQYSTLNLLEFDEHEVELDPIFEEAIVGNSNSSVSALIEKMKNSDWVKKGLVYLEPPSENEASACPFCQENTISQELAQQIENYFDESYSSSIDKIESLLSRYSTALEQLTSLDTYKSNPFSIEELSALTEQHGKLANKLEKNARLITAKKNSPSMSVFLESTRNEVANFNELLEAINAKISKHNEKLENIGAELNKLKREFWSLMRWDYDQTISALDAQVATSNQKLAESKEREKVASGIIASKKNEISMLQKSTVNIEDAIDNINLGLVQIGISDFSIAKHNDTLYKIVRIGNSTADFSSLSEGEKMIISFLYFCELCKGKRNATEVPGKKVVVIDDPISSLSHIFVFNIGRLIKSEFFDSAYFEQVFVLTHSLYFFYELADSNHKRRNEHQKLFRLFKNDEGSQILKMSYEEVQNDYHSYWSVVTDSAQPPALIANCMRNIVEYFFNFVQKQDLSNVIQMPELQGNKHQAFCRYINRESHSLGQNIFDYKEFDYESFREGLKLVFEVTGYIEHHDKMIQVLGK